MVGQYIANAAMSVINDEPYPLLDVNMARVLERYFGKRKLADIRYDPFLQELAHNLVTTKNSKVVNWAVLDIASAICISGNSKCSSCFLNNRCKFVKGNMNYD